ncbi:MAG TPA: RND transporter [Nitrospiraceae bacterium]|jgi:NodT family efflux transporter outer membrane factor (OMF) lipoprotein|nr:RND transporter [Nitrospiraceae bacterium]
MKITNNFFPACLLPLALLAACTVGPDYVRPTTETPPSFKELKGWKVAQPKDTIIRGAWWNMYNDPQLNTLEEQVNISNQNIAVAEAQFREARAQVQQARAGYFPTVSTSPSATRSRSSSGTSSVAMSKSVGAFTVNDFTLPVDATWAPDVWGRIRRTVEASRANAQASAADVEAARLLAHAEVAQDYFQLRELDSQKQLLDATVTIYQKFLELTKNRYASGVAARSDVLVAETQLKTTQAQAIDVGVQRAQLEHAIAALIGKPAADFSIPASPLMLDSVPPAIPAGVPSDLLERRPDIAAAERLVAAANAQIGVAEAAFYPTINLSTSGGFESSSLSNLLNWPSHIWAIGAALSETVFDAGLRSAQTDQARAAYDANIATYRQTVLAAFQNVEDNLAGLRILEQEALAQDEAVKAAQQSVLIYTNQYKAGTASALDVITIQAIELADRRTAITILGNRMIDSVLLLEALGGGWNVTQLPN